MMNIELGTWPKYARSPGQKSGVDVRFTEPLEYFAQSPGLSNGRYDAGPLVCRIGGDKNVPKTD
jgi:hypothetical protein